MFSSKKERNNKERKKKIKEEDEIMKMCDKQEYKRRKSYWSRIQIEITKG